MRKISKIELKTPTAMRRKRVAAYARVSMETDRLIHSLSAQISYYSKVIQANPAWEYAGVYADRGISGTGISNREEFKRLLADCEAGSVDIILTKSISRFARNTVDLLETVRHLKDLGIEVRFEKEHINSLSEDGEIMLTLLASFAQEESRSISENARWAIKKQFEKGKPKNGIIYGYRSMNGQLEIQPEEAEVVRMIFNWYLNGDSCYIIACKLNAEGIKSYYGKDWQSGVICGILRQEKYTGNSLMQKHFVENCITHKEKRNRGELPMYYAENTHKSIISQEIFDKVQQEMAQRYGGEIKNGVAMPATEMYHGKGKANAPSGYPKRKAQWSDEQRQRHAEVYKSRETMKYLHYDLSLFLKCGVCGGNLTAQQRKYADDSRGLRWVCFKHTKNIETNNIENSAPRPIPMDDGVLKILIAEVMGTEKFDADKMTATFSHISVIGDMLTFHYLDGREIAKKYVPGKRGYRRKSKEDIE